MAIHYRINFVSTYSRVSKRNVPKYNRESTLPINIKFGLSNVEEKPNDEPFDKEMFDALFSTVISITKKGHKTGGENFRHAQVKQQRGYNRRHQLPNNIKEAQSTSQEYKKSFHSNSLALFNACYLREESLLFDNYGSKTTKNKMQNFSLKSIFGFRRKSSCV